MGRSTIRSRTSKRNMDICQSGRVRTNDARQSITRLFMVLIHFTLQTTGYTIFRYMTTFFSLVFSSSLVTSRTLEANDSDAHRGNQKAISAYGAISRELSTAFQELSYSRKANNSTQTCFPLYLFHFARRSPVCPSIV